MIHRIRITNFRSLADVDVDLAPVTVLIGRSGTGKSNFVRAIVQLGELLSQNCDTYGLIRNSKHLENPKDAQIFDLTFSIPSFDERFRYRVQINPIQEKYPSYRIPMTPHILKTTTEWFYLDELLEVGDKIVFHHSKGKWIVSPNVNNPPEPKSLMLNAIPGLQEAFFAYIALQFNIGCYDLSNYVFARQGDETNANNTTEGIDNYLSIANQIVIDLNKAASWKRITNGLRAVNKNVSSLTLNVPDSNILTVGLKIADRTLTFDVAHESEGFRRYLATLLALYQTPSKQCMIFEHPETGLHPGALESLASEFTACANEGRGQIILTTHSPELLNYLPVEAFRVVDIQNQHTSITHLAPEQVDALRQGFLLRSELLTVDPARQAEPLEEVPA